jgi:hypothetical protein
MADLILICEGNEGSLDARVLNIMLVQKFNKSIQIIPAYGDANLNKVAEYHREKSRIKKSNGIWSEPLSHVFVIQDRNFCAREEVEESWAPHSWHFIWRRHEIENYLLDIRVVTRAFLNLQQSVSMKWHQELPTNSKQVGDLLQNLARPMINNFVGWQCYWTLFAFKKDLVDTGFRRPEKNSLPKKLEVDHPDRQSWLDYLHSECKRLKLDCNKLIELKEFDVPYIDQLFDRKLELVRSSEFWSSGKYIEEMGGHELVKALVKFLNLSKFPISLTDLEDEFIKALNQIYAPGFFTPDDFQILADRMI